MKKKLFLFAFVAFMFLGCSSTSVQNQTITGYIENNREYRGGANPPQFLLQELAIYKSSANQMFFIRDAINYEPFTPIITSFSTDAFGNYILNIPVGSYAVICQDKYDFEQHQQVNSNCNYLQEPDFILTVIENQQNYFNQYTNKANYCHSELPK
jgi:hypothetical protein